MRIRNLIIKLLILCIIVILGRVMLINIKLTPIHRSPVDPYYGNIAMKVFLQQVKWEKELGKVQGEQKTVDWINRKVIAPPLPPEIAEAIREAKVDDSGTLWLYFTDNMKFFIDP
jgi:hypothetical protein